MAKKKAAAKKVAKKAPSMTSLKRENSSLKKDYAELEKRLAALENKAKEPIAETKKSASGGGGAVPEQN